MQDAIRSVVIVGGGTAGWMAAASLQHHFLKTGISITVVDSSDIGSIGVGEATTPTIRHFYRNLGLADKDVMQAVDATCKLGIQFNHWGAHGCSYIHPFGLFGQKLRGVEFHHFFNKLRLHGDRLAMGDYSLGVALAYTNKISTPSPNPPSDMSHFDWALHLDASKFATVMRNFSIGHGCAHIDEKIIGVNVHSDNGFIRSLTLESGRVIEGDLFIDCSGFKGLLIEGALQTGYEDWSDYLLCDAAWVAQTELEVGPVPYTRVNAQVAGWQWKIPLRTRMGNGYVFSRKYQDSESARDVFVENLEEKLIQEPRIIHFLPGRRKKAWNKNCIALGLAAGFLEPLESTSIALIETGIEKIKLLFPDKGCDAILIDEFNDITRQEYERVRDFLMLHYWGAQRNDSAFWQRCSELAHPASLQRKISAYKNRGFFVKYPYEMFQPASWLAVYSGSRVFPDSYDPAVDNYDVSYLRDSFAMMRHAVKETAQKAPDHATFIAELNNPATAHKWT